LALILVALAPWVSGHVAEQVYNDALREFGQPALSGPTLEPLSYDRGYRQARSEVRLTLPHSPDAPDANPPSVVLVTEFRHGLAAIRATTRVRPDSVSGWSDLFPEAEPTLESRSGLNRRVRANLDIPAFELPQKDNRDAARVEALAAEVDWQPGRRLRSSLDWPGATLRTGEGLVVVEDVTLRQQSRPFTRYIWTGDSELSFASLRLEAIDEEPLILRQGRVSSSSTADGDYFDASLRMQLEELRAGDTDFGPQGFQLAISDFHGPSIDAIVASLAPIYDLGGEVSETVRAQQQMQTFVALSDALQQLSVHGGELNVTMDKLHGPLGLLDGHLRLYYPRLPEPERVQQVSLLQHARGDVNLRFDHQLLTLLPTDVLPMVVQLQKNDMIREVDGELQLVMTLEDMTLRYNGEAVELPPLL